MNRKWMVFVSSLAIAGCSADKLGMTTSGTQPDGVQGAAIHGRVHGGNNPITGASVYLYAVSTSGYGVASTPLLTNPVTTDSNGNFSITGDYMCPSATSQVYIYTNGGNPGLATNTNNTAAGLMAGLGSCSALLAAGASFPIIVVNEVSTVATAYALAGYATSSTSISSSNTSLAATGVANAFNAIANLESGGVALSTTPAGNGIAPQATINTLANILAACINTTEPSSPACSTLFSNALAGGTTGAQPTDTATAAINIAHNPIAEVANLFALQSGTAPFLPDLGGVPNDFTISIVINGGAGSEFGFPEYVAIDAAGDVWVTNGQAYCCINGVVNEYGNSGALLNSIGYYGFGMTYPKGIAIDASGNAWTANLGGTISKLSPSGTILNPTSLSGSGWTAGGLTSGYGIAIDASGNVWAGDAGGGSVNSPYDNGHGTSLVELSSSGTVKSGASGFTGGGINGPLGVAVDTAGNIWTANSGNWTISEFNGSTGAAISPSGGYTGGGLNDPYGIIVDNGPLIWTANENNSSWSLFSDTGSAYSGSSGYSGDGVTNPFSIALDGSTALWIASSNGTLQEFNAAGTLVSGPKGFADGYTNGFVGLAIDGSGNVWTVRPNGINGTSYGSITEFVGAATPIVTPMVANLMAPYGSQSVNEP